MTEARTHHVVRPVGDVLFRPDDACEAFVLVKRGAIRVSLTGANGREIVLYRVRPGEICLQTFSCLVENKRYSAEGVAEEELELEMMSRADFLRRIAEDEAFRGSVFAAVAHRFHDFEKLVEDVTLAGHDARLARALLRLKDGEGHVLATHEALAAEMASGRAAVTRQLGRFAQDGLVHLGRGRIELLDIARLARIAAEEA